MTPFEKLSEKDKDLIDDYITAFASKGDDSIIRYNHSDLNTILKEWNTEKKTLFKLLGEELIQRRLFVYKQNPEGLMKNFECHHDDTQYKSFIQWWAWQVKHKDTAKFEIEMPGRTLTFSKYFYIEEAFSDKSLAENSYPGSDYKVIFEDQSSFKVSSGMKPMKILHKFIEKFGTPEDEKMFEEFRIWHSQLLNQKTVDGELCLSIHPLDYMTMSSNNNGWTSCMRWSDKWGNIEHGDYCAGTLECMNSPYIVIAYLHNPKHTYSATTYGKVDRWEWNSKQWRELFIVNEGVISEIKAYPYQDENLTNGCITWLKELCNKNLGWEFEDEEIDVSKPIETADSIYYLDFIKPTYMYKDIGSLKKHAGRVNYNVLRDSKKIMRHQYNFNRRTEDNNKEDFFLDIPYGGVATCMWCGNYFDNEGYDNALLCPNCEYVKCCPICGEPIDSDSVYIDDVEDEICYDCYEDKTCVDSFSNESHLVDNMDSLCILLGYDENENPVYYDEWAYCYHSEDNWAYESVMTEAPKVENYHNYVTLDMIQPGHASGFANAFNIWFGWNKSIDLMSWYSNCIDEYNLYYDWNKNPLFDENDQMILF